MSQSHRKNLVRGAFVGVVVLGTGCSTFTDYRSPTPPVVPYRGPKDSVPAAESDPATRVRDALAAFVDGLASKLPGEASVGCLPLISYDTSRSGPFVSELGVTVADTLCQDLADKGFGGWLLGTQDMQVRVQDANLERKSLSTLAELSTRGERLGVDVALFGTIRYQRGVGSENRDRLDLDLQAFDFRSKAVIARAAPAFPGDVAANWRVFELAKNDGLWLEDGKWEVREEAPTLDRELEVACRVLARRLAPLCKEAAAQGALYLAPTDTATFVRSIAHLRAAQATYAAEYERRAEAARTAGAALDMQKPLEMAGTQFPDMQAAEAYLRILEESLQATDSLRFGQSLSSMLAGELRPLLTAKDLRVNDLGFTAQSNSQLAQLVKGELATGGLARSLPAREALLKEGVSAVIAARLEDLGRTLLRVEVYDLAKKNFVASTAFTLDARFEGALAKSLGTDEIATRLAPIKDVQREQAASWDKVFERVQASVVLLQGSRGAGTGFLATSAGHLITNSHVARNLGDNPQALFLDGTEHAFTVLRDDPFWDVAVLKIEHVPAASKPLAFAAPERVKPGVEVAVVGFPKGTSGWVISPGFLSSTTESVPTSGGLRPSVMYTCATRVGNSGSPVLLADGTVAAVNSHGMLGEVTSNDDQSAGRSELTGFALGAPGDKAREILDAVKGN